MGIILYIFAQLLEWLLALIFGVATIIHLLFSLKWFKGLKLINEYYYHRAFAKDQYGNVRFKIFMNMFMAENYSNPFYFGDEDDTISFATAMNYYKNKPKGLLKFVGNTLNKVDNDHLAKAINNKIKRDIEALERLKISGLITEEINVQPKYKDYKKYVEFVKNIKK